MRVTVSDPNQQRWGFQLSARALNGQQAGSLVPGGDGFTQVVSSGGIQYIGHTIGGTRNGTKGVVSFDFQWQAPNASAGPVLIHVAANAANGNGGRSGDLTYTTSLTVQPQGAGPSGAPAVNQNGIVNNASFTSGAEPLAPGSIAALFGTNLTDGTSCVAPTCFPGVEANRLRTTMAGAQVTINGRAVPIFYAVPTQLGVQIPTDLTGTSATVQVTVSGQASTSRTISLDAFRPGIFTVTQDGKGAGAITHATRTGEPLVTAQDPARPNEVLTIYATGLGQVTPSLEMGVIPGSTGQGPYRTVTTATVTIDGLPATVEFSGMATCCVGLNQVNVRVPSNARSGSAMPLVLTIGGKQSNSVTIAIGQ